MQTEPELRRAVIDHPDDDAPRLAYADWCDQQADEATQQRAEFIRAQIALAQPGAENVLLRYRADQAKRTFGPQWSQAVATLATDWHFRRGFIEFASLPADVFLRHADALFGLAPVLHVDLSNVRPVLQALCASPYLARLRSLGLSRCGLDDADIAVLVSSPHLTGLRWQSLQHNRLGLAAAEAMASASTLPSLVYADFHGNVCEPNEQYSYDSGYVVDAGLPEDGLQLERLYGPMRWLHHRATSYADSSPDRYIV